MRLTLHLCNVMQLDKPIWCAQTALNVDKGLLWTMTQERAPSRFSNVTNPDDTPGYAAACADPMGPMQQCITSPHLNPFLTGVEVNFTYGSYLTVAPGALQAYYSNSYLERLSSCASRGQCSTLEPEDLQVLYIVICCPVSASIRMLSTYTGYARSSGIVASAGCACSYSLHVAGMPPMQVASGCATAPPQILLMIAGGVPGVLLPGPQRCRHCQHPHLQLLPSQRRQAALHITRAI